MAWLMKMQTLVRSFQWSTVMSNIQLRHVSACQPGQPFIIGYNVGYNAGYNVGYNGNLGYNVGYDLSFLATMAAYDGANC
jgi:opacity protein-like surface antigen